MLVADLMTTTRFERESAKLKAQMAKRKAERQVMPPERIKYQGYEYVRVRKCRSTGNA